VDLLSVLTHELGHVLGLDDDHGADPSGDDVMGDTLALGVRRSLPPLPVRPTGDTPAHGERSEGEPAAAPPHDAVWSAPFDWDEDFLAVAVWARWRAGDHD
jgi:hypothetical protein